MIKKLCSSLAVLLTVFASSEASAADGDIWDIRPCTGMGTVSGYSPKSKDDPYNVGDEIYIRVRFALKAGTEESLARNHMAGFSLSYTGPGSETLADATELLRPALGIFASGVKGGNPDWAECVAKGTVDGYPHLFDMVFRYVVKSGDFALPIRLAGSNGLPIGEVADKSVQYVIRNFGGVDGSIEGDWKLSRWVQKSVGGEIETKPVTLLYGNQGNVGVPEAKDPRIQDMSFTSEGFCYFVKAVGFFGEDTWADKRGGIWHTVEERSTLPLRLQTPQPVDLDQSKVYYVWSDDESVFKVEDADLQVKLWIRNEAGKTVPATEPTAVKTITINGGETSANFYIRGVTNKEDIAHLVLCSSSNYFYNAYTGGRLTYDDFVAMPIGCVEAKPAVKALMSEEYAAAGEFAVLPDNEKQIPIGSMVVSLSQPYTNEEETVYVKVTPQFKDPALAAWSNYVHISEKEGGRSTWEQAGSLTLEFQPGELEKRVYVYGLCASEATAKSGFKLAHELPNEAQRGFYRFNTKDEDYPESDTVALIPNKPVIDLPAKSDDPFVAPVEMRIKVTDNYGNINDTNIGYTVYWDGKAISGKWAPDYSGELHALNDDGSIDPDKYPSQDYSVEGLKSSQIYVKGPNGQRSDPVSFKVDVPAPAVANAYFTRGAPEGGFDEGTNIEFTVSLTQPADGEKFAFLLPVDDITWARTETNRQNCIAVQGNPYSRGIRIAAGETEARGSLRVLDGEEFGTVLRYQVVLGNYDYWDGNQVRFGAGELRVETRNIEPHVSQAKIMGGSGTVTENGGAFSDKQKIPVGVSKVFQIYIDEPGVLDQTATGKDAFRVYWEIEDPFGNTTTSEIEYPDGVPYDFSGRYFALTNTFYGYSDTDPATISIRLKDKDMRDFGQPFTFKVWVTKQPTVWVQIPNEKDYYFEGSREYPQFMIHFDTGSGSIPVNLPIKVSVTPGDKGDTFAELPLRFSNLEKVETNGVTKTYYVTLPAFNSALNGSFDLRNANGTVSSPMDGMVIKVEIDSDNGTGCPPGVNSWKEYFAYEEKVVLLQNVAPTMSCSTLGDAWTTNTASIGKQFKDLTISMSDIPADMLRGVKYRTWSADGGESEEHTFEWDPESGKNSATATIPGPTFKSYGLKTFKLIYEDPDEGRTEMTWFFEIEESKTLKTAAMGPHGGLSTTLSGRYKGARGRGEGHIYVNVDGVPDYNYFLGTFNCGLVAAVDAYAWGYKSGDKDDGTLNDGRDYRLSPSGGNPPEGSEEFYEYTNECDSFLYCWLVQIESSSSSGKEEERTLAIELPNGRAALKDVKLPEKASQSDKVQYPITYLEAVFAKEFLWSDNLGDINHDGVPDIYTSQFDLGVFDEKGEIGDDLADLRDYNEDGDMLPALETAALAATWNPGSVTNWGDAFGAAMELRGYGEALNDATAEAIPTGVTIANGKTNISTVANIACAVSGAAPEKRYTDPDLDEDQVVTNRSTLSKVEYVAFTNYIAEVNAKLAEDEQLDPADPATWAFWSPERPTDPTKYDTDLDDLPDGWEYYVWYHAFVGSLDAKGNLQRMTGRKYDPLNPSRPVTITSAEIAAAYDPLVKNGAAKTKDTDNDGLPDYMEFAIGSNPFDFDTDGDGLPDGWEVLVNLTDPCTYATDGGRCDADRNDDGDTMAFAVKNFYLYPFEKNGETNYVAFVGPAPLTGEEDSEDPAVTNYTVNAKCECWATWKPFGQDTLVLGYRYDGAKSPFDIELVKGFDATKVQPEGVELWHSDVAAFFGYSPRTGWKRPPDSQNRAVNTRLFTAKNEFDMIAWQHFVGCDALELQPDDKGAYVDRILPAVEITPTTKLTQYDIWVKYGTNPLNADTDADNMPDGWELYLMAGDGEPARMREFVANGPYSPLFDINLASDDIRDNDKDGLDWPDEFSGVDTAEEYADCETITLIAPEWTSKKWPSNPWKPDTDQDGLSDGSEQGCFKEIGGLNPCSMDTDLDGLPDAFEAEFAGTGTLTPATTEKVTSVDPDGTTNTVERVIPASFVWNNDGMCGVMNDAELDYDHDGLSNWQEYLVGAMRCWRYDDTVSRWEAMHCDSGMIPPAGTKEWNKFWYDHLDNLRSPDYNPRLVDGRFDGFGRYFTPCMNTWDPAYGKWYMLKGGLEGKLTKAFAEGREGTTWTKRYAVEDLVQSKYICCDPTKADTDGDGMDDFYELFHGLNPLLGLSASDSKDGPCDVIFVAYGAKPLIWHAEDNVWFNEVALMESASRTLEKSLRVKHKITGSYADVDKVSYWDFEAFPWLNGSAMADPDGDNIRNQQEAIMPGMQAASSYQHLDPTPLWMTDRAYANSLVRLYYAGEENRGDNFGAVIIRGPLFYVDPNDASKTNSFANYLYMDMQAGLYKRDAFWSPMWPGFNWRPNQFFFSFEENEGYDSDGDGLSDFEESQSKTKSSSDPQDHDDPIRRQAMYFNGEDAFLQSPLEVHEQTASDMQREDFLYYTVECWAKPDEDSLSGDRTLVERAIHTDKSGPADENFCRKNFQIAIKNGFWYTKYDTTGTDKGQGQAVAVTGPAATTNWTHVAASYDGEMLRLYVDGIPVAQTEGALQPEHGRALVQASSTGSRVEEGDVVVYPLISMLVGASAKNSFAIVYDNSWRCNIWDNPDWINRDTTIYDYTAFYKGYIDEVRIWDGARTAEKIYEDYRVRYTAELAAANREKVYQAWASGQDRTAATGDQLPAELMYHWSFDHVPGAVEAADVMQVPAGFNAGTALDDAKAKWVRPAGWFDARWASVSVRSTVYTDCAWVPWIRDTVSHLPRYDGTTVDSFYWSDTHAGAESGEFKFPHTHELYSRWFEARHAFDHKNGASSAGAFLFTQRKANTEGSDLLPMGGAFPKRISAAEGGMWDDGKPADAWAQVGKDTKNLGLPDAWQQYAKDHYGASDAIDWNTTLPDYNGQPMPAGKAYLRDLANGLVIKDGTADFDDNFKDTRDLDGDGIPDWWEDLYGVDTHSSADANADPDHDGLSTYQEYLLSETDTYGTGYPQLDPSKARTGGNQLETDYFLVATNDQYKGQYLGEIVADHDFMEDAEEDQLGSDRHRYDAWSDNDEDGWSNFSELRYSTFKNDVATRFISHLVSEEEVLDCPMPIVHATLRYNGDKVANGSNSTIVVEAYAGNNLKRAPTAVFTVTPGQTETRHLNLGTYGQRVVHGTLTPGHVVAGLDAIKLQTSFVQPYDNFSWTVGDERFTGTYANMWKAWNANMANGMSVNSMAFGWTDTTQAAEPDGRNILQLAVDDPTQKARLLLYKEEVGSVDLVTGDFDLDLAPLSKYHYVGSAVGADQQFFRIEYMTKIPTLQGRRLEVSLSNADKGKLVEASTTFVAFMDLDGDGVYTPGEPMGIKKGVDVSWDSASIEIELTDASQAAGARLTIPAVGADSNAVDLVSIVRAKTDGNSEVKHRVVYQADLSARSRRTIHEGDIISGSKFGLDWKYLNSDLGAAITNVGVVTYAIMTGDIAGGYSETNDNIIGYFDVTYNTTITPPVCVSPSAILDQTVAKARPTFKWTGPTDCVAYRLQIADTDTNVVYFTACAALPPRNSSSQYVFDADAWVDAVQGEDNWSLANNTQYLWRVAMFNDKYPDSTNDAEVAWSDWSQFQTRVATSNDRTTSFGCADVAVSYFGPAGNGCDQVIVQLFKSADFSGRPVAQARLAETNGTISALKSARTVRFIGLEAGNYYACAFVDRNGNGARERYEIWGYAANVGKGTAAIWTPMTIKVDPTYSKVPMAELFMEDTDVNMNGVLDYADDEAVLRTAVAEQEQAFDLIIAGAAPADDDGGGSADPLNPEKDLRDEDHDGLTNSEEGEIYTKKGQKDTDGDKMPDGWEAKYALTDPLQNDAGETDGSVMAYAEVEVTVVTLSDGTVTEFPTKFAVIAPAGETYYAGQSLKDVSAWTTFQYGDILALGQPTNLTGVSAAAVSRQKVAAVHAQVYTLFGYDPTTANEAVAVVSTNGVEGCAHTKLMTALDKYLVAAYLQAVGVFTAAEVSDEKTGMDAAGTNQTDKTRFNANNAWFAHTLMPGYTDHDADGLTDGWELYVMFGTNTVWNRDAAKLSPFVGGESTNVLDGVTAAAIKLNGGLDPWDPYSLWKLLKLPETRKFTDIEAIKFRLQDGDLAKDEDFDGLSNYQEMLACRADAELKLDPQNAKSDGNTIDYFRTTGGKTLGELYNGAEFIEPFIRAQFNLEDLRKAGTIDTDSNGWDLWSEARYTLLTGVTETQYIVDEDGVTNEVEVVVGDLKTPVPEITLKLVYSGSESKSVVIEAYQGVARRSDVKWSEIYKPAAKWSETAEFKNGVAKIKLTEAQAGLLQQGAVRFVAYIDNDGDGQFSIPDTYGEVECEVGYLGGEFTVRLGDPILGLPGFSFTNGSNVVNEIRYVRTKVNGRPVVHKDSAKGPHTAYKRIFQNNAERETIYPSDYLHMDTEYKVHGKDAEALYIGFDQGLAADEKGVSTALQKAFGIDYVDEVEYEILIGQGPFTVSNLNSYAVIESNQLASGGWQFRTNVVETGAANQTFTVGFSRIRDLADVLVKGDQLEGDNVCVEFTVPKKSAVTKFWIDCPGLTFMQTAAGNNDIGYLLPNPADGVCCINLADYIEGDGVAAGIYTVKIALGNDKFATKPTDKGWSKTATFSVGEAASFEGKLTVITSNGSANRYALYDTADLVNAVHVQDAPSFTNLKIGHKYYVAAWNVRNANDGRPTVNTRMPYDTWGYATMLGEQANGFDAMPIEVTKDAQVTVYLQKTDWNQNGIDDENEDLSAIHGIYTRGGGYIDYLDDFDLDGMPDKWEEQSKGDDEDEPGEEDDTGDTEVVKKVTTKDVMAYYARPNSLFIGCSNDGSNTNLTWFLVYDPTNAPAEYQATDVSGAPSVQLQTPLKELNSARVMTIYPYSDDLTTPQKKWDGVGTNLNVTAFSDDWKVQETRIGYARFVHAQIYSLFGFNPKTCVGTSDSVYTKNFTSSDKYRVCRYLQAIGIKGVDEGSWKTNMANQWIFSLKSGVKDQDRDGMYDGWELYTMFGPDGFVDLQLQNPYAFSDLTNAVPAGIISPFDPRDGQQTSASGELKNVQEYNNGIDPSDPWAEQSIYDALVAAGLIPADTTAFNDAEAPRFGVSALDYDKDFDFDLVSNWAEMYASYVDRTNVKPQLDVYNAWSDGVTPDYFRKFVDPADGATKWLGLYDNGGEFIEPTNRVTYGIDNLVMAGTVDTDENGWDLWSEVRYTLLTGGKTEKVAVVDEKTGETNEVEVAVEGELATPVAAVELTVKYVGNESQSVIVEAYQTPINVPELGEQLTARWTANAEFLHGVAQVKLEEPATGALVQGPATFVVYVDADGNGRLNDREIFGTAKTTVGYLGAKATVRLGGGNDALPVITLDMGGDGSNTVGDVAQTIAIVRTKINGQRIAPRGVTLRKYDNNLNRTAPYPAIYVSEDFIGLDRYLAQDPEDGIDPSEEVLENVESVTYEIVKISRNAVTAGDEGSRIGATNLNHYTYTIAHEDAESGDVSNEVVTVDQEVNEEFTIRYSITRDIAQEVVGSPASKVSDAVLSFTVPTDRAVTKFWLDGIGSGEEYLLDNVAEDGRVVLDAQWFAEHGIALAAQAYTVKIGLGNDKFPMPPSEGEWSAPATFSVSADAVREGKIAVAVHHPTREFKGTVTIAVYETADLSAPVAGGVVTGTNSDELVVIDGLRAGGEYYVAAWNVKNPEDSGLAKADRQKTRKPWDSWGYISAIGTATNGFDAASVTAEKTVGSETNIVYLQDTDFNDNAIADVDEDIISKPGVTDPENPSEEEFDVDQDGIPDVDDPDPVMDNSKTALEYDVMAYVEQQMFCVQIGEDDVETNWTWYVVRDVEADRNLSGEIPVARGTEASTLKSLWTTYRYGNKRNSPFGIGQKATLEKGVVKNYEFKKVVLVHAQVYAECGFDPNTANGFSAKGERVNTKAFTATDKYLVTNYLAAVGALAEDAILTNWTLSARNIDFDRDGMLDG